MAMNNSKNKKVEWQEIAAIAGVLGLLVATLTLFFGPGILKQIWPSQNPEPSFEIISVGDIVVEAGEKYTSEWRLTIPVKLLVTVWSKSDVIVANSTFQQNPYIRPILVEGFEDKTSVLITERIVERVETTDSEVMLFIPVRVVVWVKGDYGIMFGETREKIGTFSFDIVLVELATNKTKSLTVSKDVFWVRLG